MKHAAKSGHNNDNGTLKDLLPGLLPTCPGYSTLPARCDKKMCGFNHLLTTKLLTPHKMQDEFNRDPDG